MTHIKKDHGEVIYNEIRSELYSMKPEPESAVSMEGRGYNKHNLMTHIKKDHGKVIYN